MPAPLTIRQVWRVSRGVVANGNLLLYQHLRRPTSTAIPTNLSIHQPHPLYGRSRTTNSSGNLSDWSAQSCASERLPTIVNSRESLFAPVDRPSRLPRGTYRQFGRGPDPSQIHN